MRQCCLRWRPLLSALQDLMAYRDGHRLQVVVTKPPTQGVRCCTIAPCKDCNNSCPERQRVRRGRASAKRAILALAVVMPDDWNG